MTMQALIASDIGAPLELKTTPRPEPLSGQIRIKVAGCGVNFADTLLIAGTYQEKQEPPITPGVEVSGTIDAIGEGAVIESRPAELGARVAAMCARGMAEYAIADARAAALLPEGIDFATAAAAPVAYGTGLLALRDRAQLAAGERLLVTGAAGGVGLTAVEIGKLLGAEVVAAARGAEKCALTLAKGADHALDVSSADLRTELKAMGGIDVAYETIGGAAWEAAFRAARPGARLLPIGFAGGDVPQIPANIMMVKNVTAIGFYWGGWLKHRPEAFGAALAQIYGWIAQGKVAPEVRAMPLSEGEAALEALRRRNAVGKIVLTP